MEKRISSSASLGGLFAVLILASVYTRAESVESTAPPSAPKSAAAKDSGKKIKADSVVGDKILEAKYDKDRGVMLIAIESSNHCNIRGGDLIKERSGRATFGPHIYRLDFGMQTMMGCQGRQVKKIEVPFDEANASGKIMIHLTGKKDIVTAQGIDEFKKRQVQDLGTTDSNFATTRPQEATGRN